MKPKIKTGSNNKFKIILDKQNLNFALLKKNNLIVTVEIGN